MMQRRALSAGLLLVALWPATASAQIYAWRDAAGTLVLSDRPIETPTHVYQVPGAAPYVTTTPGNKPRADERYGGLIHTHATQQSVRPELVRAVIQVESGFDPRALSPKGAMGLMQLMPATARSLGVNDPWDPAQNIRGGTTYLRQLLDRYDGSEELALAAYNAGPGAVERYGSRVPPYRETREYVHKVTLGAAEDARDPVPARKPIFKTIEIIDGRAVPRYSTVRPALATYEVVTR
jgi:soluble lytic murein transglycosylase-like protein